MFLALFNSYVYSYARRHDDGSRGGQEATTHTDLKLGIRVGEAIEFELDRSLSNDVRGLKIGKFSLSKFGVFDFCGRDGGSPPPSLDFFRI